MLFSVSLTVSRGSLLDISDDTVEFFPVGFLISFFFLAVQFFPGWLLDIFFSAFTIFADTC